MTRPIPSLSRAGLAVVVALGVAGCAPQQQPDPLPTVASDSPATAQPEAPRTENPVPPGGTQQQQRIALDAAKIMTTWTPATDTTRTDAELRARHLMTPERAAAVIAPQKPTGGAEWAQAQKANATSVPTVEVNDAVDGNVVEVHATWTWRTPDGAELPNQPRTVRYYRFAFSPTDPGKIEDYTYQDRTQG